MGKRDKRVDAYIAKSNDFAKPILTHLRKLIHQACPDVEETVKWSFPHFMSKGVLCSMASFKQHAVFGFWKASILPDPDKILALARKSAMGHLGQIRDLSDLPSDKVLVKYIKEAAKLNAIGAKPVKKSAPKKKLSMPPYFKKELNKNKRAAKTFEELSPSHQREYIEWITEAKTDETRSKRMGTTIEWLSEGKSRNWKYERK
jgi:uncharacterized protein YdeI (YjbR/CyaY-like superfamily)